MPELSAVQRLHVAHRSPCPPIPFLVGKVRSARVPNDLELPIETSLVIGVSSRQSCIKLLRKSATAECHGPGFMVRSSVSHGDNDKNYEPMPIPIAISNGVLARTTSAVS